MYLKIILAIIFTAFLQLEVKAQFVTTSQSDVQKSEINFSFIPQQLELGTVAFKAQKTSTNRVLTSAGFLLKNLTFNSPIDRFNAQLPYDQRVYEPKTVSELSSKLSTNLLLNKNLIGFLP